jgi:hypothetical protein
VVKKAGVTGTSTERRVTLFTTELTENH